MNKWFIKLLTAFLIVTCVLAPVNAKKKNKVVYLTFDDGPSSNTPEILKVLNKYHVKATFFVIGINNTKYQKYIKKAYLSGHAIGLHSYNHSYKNYKSVKKYFEDLKKISDVVMDKTGEESKLLRFPGGSSNTISRRYKKKIMTKLTKEVTDKGYKYYDWNLDSGDADGNNMPVDYIVNRSKSKMSEICLLMHDAKPKTNTVKALPEIIKYYKSRGYQFKTLKKTKFTCHHHINN